MFFAKLKHYQVFLFVLGPSIIYTITTSFLGVQILQYFKILTVISSIISICMYTFLICYFYYVGKVAFEKVKQKNLQGKMGL